MNLRILSLTRRNSSLPMLHKRYFLLFFCFILFFKITLHAQNFTVDGVVLDENDTPLEACNLILLSKKDSFLIAGSTSDSVGFFQLNEITAGDYWLLITYLGYVPMRLDLPLPGLGRTLHLGKILLKCDTKTLGEVRIVAKATPVVVRNDTIYYNAASFQTRQNAAVLDLLKKIAGHKH